MPSATGATPRRSQTASIRPRSQKLVLDAIEARRLYIFTHADRRNDIERRFAAMMEGFQALAGEAPQTGIAGCRPMERR